MEAIQLYTCGVPRRRFLRQADGFCQLVSYCVDSWQFQSHFVQKRFTQCEWFLMAVASLFPIALIVGNFSLILFRRDLHSVSGFWVSFQYFILSFFIAPSFFSDDDDHDRHYFKKNNCNKEKL